MRLASLLPSAIAAAFAAATLPSFSAEPRIDLLGDPAPASAATRTIVLAPGTRYVNVTGGDIVQFIVGDKSFTWSFNVAQNVSSFDLKRVAPPGLLQQEVRAYIAPDPRYMGGGDKDC